jgi:hypothetical protein
MDSIGLGSVKPKVGFLRRNTMGRPSIGTGAVVLFGSTQERTENRLSVKE